MEKTFEHPKIHYYVLARRLACRSGFLLGLIYLTPLAFWLKLPALRGRIIIRIALMTITVFSAERGER